MMVSSRTTRGVAVFVSACVVFYSYQWMSTDTTITTLLGDVPSPQILADHNNEFKQGIVKVTDGLYMAIGYALANSILIEGTEGAIVVDTTESIDSGREIYAAFRNITKAPIKVIVYTHNHADHMYGTAAFINDSSPPDIWAHHTLPELVDSTSTVLPLTYSRATRQFGNLLRQTAPSVFLNSGIGPFLRVSTETAAGLIPPTHLMHGEKQDVVLAGLPVTLVHIPGETSDQIGVWIPSKKAFLCADDLYRTFPNLYAIRGTPTRDTLDWVASMDKMIAYEPEYLVPSHTRPLHGRKYIRAVLTDYRDAIQFVHDQTVRYMNTGMLPDDIVTKVQLPERLAKSPFLQTFYGTLEWSVRAVFDRYMGWFSGNIAELSRHSTLEKAKRVIKLAGGIDQTLTEAEAAVKEDDFRWALELSTYILAVDKDHVEAKAVRLLALKALASQQVSANGRNYYLTVALEDHGLVDTAVPLALRQAAIMFMTPVKLFQMLRFRLMAEEVTDINMAITLNLTDINEVFTLTIRNCIMDVTSGPSEEATITVTVEYELFKGIISGNESALTAYMSGALHVHGGIVHFKTFMGYFDRS